jgi:hypothetical protein
MRPAYNRRMQEDASAGARYLPAVADFHERPVKTTVADADRGAEARDARGAPPDRRAPNLQRWVARPESGSREENSTHGSPNSGVMVRNAAWESLSGKSKAGGKDC